MSNNSSNQEIVYNRIKQIGEGSFAQVYLVEDIKTKKQYVLKTILLEGLKDKEYKETLKEVSIIQKLDHPNIIKLYEAFLCKLPRKKLNLITEYADGGDLSNKIDKLKERNKFLSEDLILDYFTQICLALYHIHKKKIIHRDIKSKNVFVTKNGIIKLGDFGISTQLANTWDFAQTLKGTPYYLAPEVISNYPYNTKADIWSLGVLLYELITFKLPFDANNIPFLFMSILKGKYKSLPDNTSKDLKNLVDNLLQVDPDKRPTIKDILKYDILKKRMQVFLMEVNYNKDFSVTFIKTIKKKKKEQKRPSKFKNLKLDNNVSVKKTHSYKNNKDKKDNTNQKNLLTEIDQKTNKKNELYKPLSTKNNNIIKKEITMNFKNDNKKEATNNNIIIQDENSNSNTNFNQNNFKDFVVEKTSSIYFEQDDQVINFADFDNNIKVSNFFGNNNNEHHNINVENDYIPNFRDKRDLFDAHRILDDYSNILNNKELVDDDKSSNDSSLLDNTNIYNEKKIIPDETLDSKPEIILTKSMFNNKEDEKIKEIKNDLYNFFGEHFNNLLIIFNDYCDKEKCSIDIQGIRHELIKNGMSKEQIDVIIKKSPEFICLCINDKIN